MQRTIENYLKQVVIRDGEKWIYNDVNLFNLGLTDIDYFSDINVSGYFSCSYNKRLKSLKGSPKSVGDRFYAYNCSLTSLQGISQKIGENIDISDNPIETLEGLGEFGGLLELTNMPKNCNKTIELILSGKIKLCEPS